MSWRSERRALARAQRFGGLRPSAVAALALEEPEAEPEPVVGWMRPATGSVKGTDHLCLECAPMKPFLDAIPVYGHQLAATVPCGVCCRRLEDYSC